MAVARKLIGKLALVTGSSSGIGYGVAEALAAQGADIVLHGVEPVDELARIGKVLSDQFDVRVFPSDCNLLDGEEAIVAAVAGATTAAGQPVDILVNNAGIQHVSPIEDFAMEAWERVIAINLTAAFAATKAVLPPMREAGWGRIINVASVHGEVASVNKSAYVAAKHGILGLTKVTALETANSGVTCNAIQPGWVLTPLVEAQIEARADASGRSFEEEQDDLLREKQPQRRFATPRDIGELAAFMCSDAAANMTGESVAIDGGWTAQ